MSGAAPRRARRVSEIDTESCRARWAGFTDSELRRLAKLLAAEVGFAVEIRAALRMRREEAARAPVNLTDAVMVGIRVQHTAISQSLPALRRHIKDFLRRWPSNPYSGHATAPAMDALGLWRSTLSYDPKGAS